MLISKFTFSQGGWLSNQDEDHEESECDNDNNMISNNIYVPSIICNEQRR